MNNIKNISPTLYIIDNSQRSESLPEATGVFKHEDQKGTNIQKRRLRPYHHSDPEIQKAE